LVALLPTERSTSRALTSRSPQAPEPEPRRVPRDPEVVAPNLTMSDADLRWQATLEMMECGPAAIPALVEAERFSTSGPQEWTGSQWCVRAHVHYAVLRIGKPAIAPLTEALEGDRRLQAIRLLGVLGTRYDEVLEPLVACLDPEGHEDTYSAAFALSRMGERAAPALPELARIFECEGISWAVADSIVRIGPGTSSGNSNAATTGG
jgi:hypothetical protein